MKKLILFTLFVIASSLMYGQIDAKYLKGVVPEVDGKVTFSKIIKPDKKKSEKELFNLLDSWAKKKYGTTMEAQQSILLSDANKDIIACKGYDTIVFKESTFFLDQAFIYYQLIIRIEKGVCNVTVRNIKYDYGEIKNISAEEQISDENALYEDKSLYRGNDKFRIKTIDYIDNLFQNISTVINGRQIVGSSVRELEIIENTPIAQQRADSPMAGYKQIAPDKIPGNIIKLLEDDWSLITSGIGDSVNVMTASWGGIGILWEKPVAFCFIKPTRYSIQTMDRGDTYTISFYTVAYHEALEYCGSVSGRDTDKIKGSGLTPIKTPLGATAFSEAWLILECRKMVAQPILEDGVTDKDAKEKWSENGYHKMYIGEIVNAWMK